jgi:hypothetical protein
MTNFKDVNGLQEILGIKLNGATEWMGKSANIAAMDTTDGSALVFSISNYASVSATSTVFDCAATGGTKSSNTIGQLIAHLGKMGLATVYYDGTNKI